ncbi:MAG: oligosaccharide flippase family protein [Candidatus Micrarchaeales archaeon]
MAFENQTVENEVEELSLSTAKMSVIYIGGEIISSLVTLFLLIFLARYLQPASYGVYTIAIAFNGVLVIVSNSGIGQAFRKMIPELRQTDKTAIKEFISNGYILAFGLGLIIAIIGILASNYIAVTFYGGVNSVNASLVPQIAMGLELASFAVLLTTIFNLTQGGLLGLGLSKEASIANIVYSIINLIAAVGLVLLGYGVVGALVGFIIGMVFGTITGTAYIYKKTGALFGRPNIKVLKKIWNFSVRLIVTYTATYGAQSFSILLLGVYATAAILGNYGAAFKLARAIELLISSMTFVLLGTFSAALAKKVTAAKIGELYNNSIYYTALFLLPFVAYAAATTQPIIGLLFSTQYSFAPLYFAIIAVGMTIGLIGSYAGTLIISKGDTKRFMKYQVGAVILQLILLFIFTPTYQALGVLLSLFVITPLLLNFIYMRALEEQFKFKHEFNKLARLTVSAIVVGIIMFYISSVMNQSKWALIANAVILLLLFPPLAAFTKGITKKNLEFIENTGKRLKQLKALMDPLVKYSYIFVRE